MASHGVQVRQLEGIPLAVIRRQAAPSELSRVVPECCGLVWNVVRAQNVKAGRNVAVYLDDQIHIEVGVELLGPFSGDVNVVQSATPAGVVAAVTHFGPYAGLTAAHEAVHRWSRSNGHRLSGPRWEIYGHWQPEWHSDPSLIRTDLCYLLLAA